MTIPHNFPSLIEGQIRVVIIAGTGLSTPNAPTLNDLKDSLTQIADALGATNGFDPMADDYFYDLAEAVLNKLVSDGKKEFEARLWVAEQLGMLNDRRWFGEIGLPLSGNTPRHRVIARFAVENRLKSIISLNWDTLLEAALDSVGLTEDVSPPRPWQITRHVRVINNNDMPKLAFGNVFPVIKPHGCVRNLQQAQRDFRSGGATPLCVTFKLKKTELEDLPAEQRSIIDQGVRVDAATCPVIAIGWKAAEGYLRNALIETAIASQHTECDRFTLISRSWYPSGSKTNTYHDQIANAYGKTKSESFFEVENPGQPKLDQTFLWLQAYYALNRVHEMSTPLQRPILKQMLQQLVQPDYDHPIISWADAWLPSWIRLCWRAGAMRGADPCTGRTIEAWEIPLMPRDVHIPLGCMTQDRRDLQAATNLLISLGGTLRRFRFDMFPGGLWSAEERCLYLPLPSWLDDGLMPDLAALKPLIEALHKYLAFVKQIHLVCLDKEDVLPGPTPCRQLEAKVRSMMPFIHFAYGDALDWVSLEAMKGGNHADVA